jgi:short-chain fatty acids transporter
MTISEKFAKAYTKILPSPFVIAIILTFITFIIALVFTKPNNVNHLDYILKLSLDWESGLWNKSTGGLYFAFQMMLMLVLGHVLALSAPVSKLIDKLIKYCNTTAQTAAIVTFFTIIVSLFNWGLGLIFGAILARKIGEKFSANNQPLNYALIGAAAYSGLMVWHGGISGSAPLKVAEKGELARLVNNVDLTLIPESIPLSDTVFSTMNITVSIALIVILPALMYMLGQRKYSHVKLPSKIILKNEIESKDEKLDNSRIFSTSIGLSILIFALYKAFILPEKLSLNFINPNYINLFLFGCVLLLHKNIKQFLSALNIAINDASGILIQFPLYFGILGIMTNSGLITDISESFVAVSNEFTFPIYTFISAGFINIFVPSGGGQWVVQGPIIISAATELGLSYPKAVMSIAYGDQLTNMLQPFWALPLLGITGLKAKQILPYTLILFLAGAVIFLAGLIIF